LYRKLKALTGQSPVELLRKARLQKGRRLLQSTTKSISEVAYEVGFSAPSYFTKCFKDEFGVSPSDIS
jgi:AraC-like DNA-binding protein